MSLKVSQISFSKESVGRHQNGRISDKGHFAGMRISDAYEKQGTSTTKLKGKLRNSSVLSQNQEKSVNKSINTTAVNNYSGRISFQGGAAPAAMEIGGRFMQGIAKNKLVQKFVELADKKVLVCEAAVALLINCTLRPATIMTFPSDKNDYKKNKKAAAKSIASGIAGFVTAQVLTSPLNKAVEKMSKNPAKYLLTENALKQGLNRSTKTVLSQGFAMGLSPLRATLTVALLPIIDKNIISKIYGDNEDSKQDYMMNHLYLRGSEMATDTFKKFREGRI